MIELRPFASIGRFANDWLNAHHHFSFGHYRDPKRMGFGSLVVWNDDEIAAGQGFNPHPHRDMEIITYVRQGAITHRDNLGNEGVTKAGDVQVMHAGTGIVHGEFNLEPETTTLFQIWVTPDRTGVAPGWGAREFPRDSAKGLTVLASGRASDAQSGALPLYADAAVMAGKLKAGETVTYRTNAGRALYLVPATGRIAVAGQDAAAVEANARDGLAIAGEREITITAQAEAEIVLVDVRG